MRQQRAITSQHQRLLSEILAALRELQGAARQLYQAEIVGVFGSYARGEAHRQSDVDVLVRFQEGASLLDLAGLSDFLREQLGIKVDVVSERALRPELRERILGELVRL